jgi:hypothetical protein
MLLAPALWRLRAFQNTIWKGEYGLTVECRVERSGDVFLERFPIWKPDSGSVSPLRRLPTVGFFHCSFWKMDQVSFALNEMGYSAMQDLLKIPFYASNIALLDPIHLYFANGL